MRRFLTFDDVGLIPKFNHIASRLDTNLTITLHKDKFKSPFIPANMDSVIGTDLAKVCRIRGAPIYSNFLDCKKSHASELYISLNCE